MIGLLKNKIVINDQLLVLCLEFCQQQKKSKSLLNKLIESINQCIYDCLVLKNSRNYWYFKHYLLFSNIVGFQMSVRVP